MADADVPGDDELSPQTVSQNIHQIPYRQSSKQAYLLIVPQNAHQIVPLDGQPSNTIDCRNSRSFSQDGAAIFARIINLLRQKNELKTPDFVPEKPDRAFDSCIL